MSTENGIKTRDTIIICATCLLIAAGILLASVKGCEYITRRDEAAFKAGYTNVRGVWIPVRQPTSPE